MRKTHKPHEKIPTGWEVRRLREVLKYEQPTKYLAKNAPVTTGQLVPVLTANKSFILGYTNETDGIYKDVPAIIFDDFTTDKKYVTFPFKVKSSAIKILKPKKNVNLRFVFEKTKLINFAIRDHKRYYISGYQNLAITIPNFAEQTAIAQVLSDTDALIQALDQLITKQKALQKATMQQLLTGKKRLKGCKGKWQVKKLGEIGKLTASGVNKKIRKSEVPVKLLNYLDIYHKDFLYKEHVRQEVTAPSHQAKKCAITKGDIFFTPSSEKMNDIAHSAVAMENIPDACYSYHIVRFRLAQSWDNKFKAYIFKTRKFLNQCEVLSQGSGKRYVISLKNFNDLEIVYPSSLAEQTAIAQVLSDMDASLATLIRKKEKYTHLKQGMMQQLLTGKIRLL